MRTGNQVRLILELLRRSKESIWRRKPQFRNRGAIGWGGMTVIEGKLVAKAPQGHCYQQPANPQCARPKYLFPKRICTECWSCLSKRNS